MSSLANYDIRYSEMGDLDIMKNWFSDEASCDPFPFGFKEKEDALKNWIGFSKYKASLTGLLDGLPCSVGTLFLMPYRKVAHHCSFYLIVDPAHRRKGIGFSMVRNLLHLARTRFQLESVHVEIFEPNGLLPLVEKLNFQVFARQENYEKIDGCGHSRVLLEHFF